MNAPIHIKRTLPKRNGGSRIPLSLLAALVLAIAALIFALSAQPAPAASTIPDGSFEEGPLTWPTPYWQLDVSPIGGGVRVVDRSYQDLSWIPLEAQDGIWYALLMAVDDPQWTSMSSGLPFYAAPGDTISGYVAAFPYEPIAGYEGQVIIRDANGGVVATPFDRNDNTVTTYGWWTPWKYTFEQEGIYTVEARVSVPTAGRSYLALDNVVFTQADTTPPRFTPQPADMSVDATSAEGALVSYDTPTAYDDGDGAAANVTCDPASGSLFPIGTTTVTCKATDSKGNSAQASFLVTVKDVIVPSIVQRFPNEDQTDVPKTANVTVTFSEEVQGIDDTTFKLERMTRKGFESVATAPPSTELITDQGEQVTRAVLDPTRSLHGGNWYRVTITSGITDMAGNQYAGAKWDFKVQ